MREGNTSQVQDLDRMLQWGFCPMKVWWNEDETVKKSLTGEELYRTVIFMGLKLYFQKIESVQAKKVVKNPDKIIKDFWSSLLFQWELTELEPLLDEYAKTLKTLKTEFRMRTHDYAIYSSAKNLLMWEKAYQDTNLRELSEVIQKEAAQVNLVRQPLLKPSVYFQPMGLAEAYSRSFETFRRIWNSIDYSKPAVLVNEDMYISGPIHDYKFKVDLVLNIGEQDQVKVGRPKKNPIRKYDVQLVMFSFDYELPLMNELSQNIRFKAMNIGQIKTNDPSIEYRPTEIKIIHIYSGQTQVLKIKETEHSQFIVAIEELGRSYSAARNTGAYIPRSIHSTSLCHTCEYFNHCFSSDGEILFHKGVTSAKYKKDTDMVTDMHLLLGNMDPKGTFFNEKDLLNLLRFFEKYPGISPNEFKQMIEYNRKLLLEGNAND